jgi:membrane protein implicated in regulation of membrane protease activity
VVRYSLLRLLIFFGVLAALWLLGLREPEEQILLLVLAAAISMLISFVVLKRFRDDYSRQINERLQQRAQAKQQRRTTHSDEQAEDAEDAQDDGPQGNPGPQGNQGPVEYR